MSFRNWIVFGTVVLALTCAKIAGQVPPRQQNHPAQTEADIKAPATTTKAQPAEKAVIKEESCGCEVKLPTDRLATVNGVSISTREIEATIKDSVARLEQQVIEARKRELDLQINTRLLEAEAKRRGISSIKLLTEEIVDKTKPPAEVEAKEFYDRNREKFKVTFEQAREQILDYLGQQRQRDAAKSFADRMREAAQIKVLVEQATAPETEADRARVFATVNGERITSSEIEDKLQPLIYQVQQQIYQLRLTELELKINDALLQQEAFKRKVTPQAWLEAESAALVRKPTESDARAFYEQNQEKMNAEFSRVKDQILAYLEQNERRKAESALATKLRQAATIQIFLTEPESPIFTLATDDQPSKGRADAPVTIIEFTDFECPTCAKLQPVIENLLKEFGDKVRLIVRDFPLEQHALAPQAAEAAEAAREQGKYWEYVELLFRHQPALAVDQLKEYASKLGLDRRKFDAALNSGKFKAQVERDLQDGFKLGINSTPTIFVNGRRISEKTYESLKSAITSALKSETAAR